MLDWLILTSLKHRAIVLIGALILGMLGLRNFYSLPVDVFPDLNRPTVTIMTESPGLAPEEVELLVTRPMEYLLHGATGVKRVRSSSGIGLSIIWVEFDWGTDIFVDRQIVAEKLQLARERLPRQSNPMMAPISSIMGEIMLVGLRSTARLESAEDQLAKSMELRSLGEFQIRNRLLSIDGVSQVTAMGGTLKQYQILTSPARLAAQNVTLAQLTEAASKANVLAGAGVVVRSPKESLVRISGQSLTLEDIENTPVLWRENTPIRIRDVATVRLDGPIKRGEGAVWVKRQFSTQPQAQNDSTEAGIEGGPAVIMTVQKQPRADTVALDRRIQLALDEIRKEVPEDVVIEDQIFRQSEFISSAVQNVTEAVRDGAIWVVVVLFILMGNLRTSFSSLTSMPLSILLTLIVFQWMDISINTMTLGGIAVAIGDLVDDSIVDIENIYRRLRENSLLPETDQRPSIEVIYRASAEIRNSIVYATLIVVLVVVPLFFMSGLEGRMFAPLGLAYLVSLICSLLVSLTFTPVLSSFLLTRAHFVGHRHEPWLMRQIKRMVRPWVRMSLDHAWATLLGVTMLVLITCCALGWMGGEFLPEFHEGTLTINMRMEPGTSLDESQRIASRAERELLRVEEVVSVARRTGRAEMDEHAEGVYSSEIDVRLTGERLPRPGIFAAISRWVPVIHQWGYVESGRPRAHVVADIRDRISSIPGTAVNIGQPISHRLDHLLSGIRAQVAIKVFGNDLRELRSAAFDIQSQLETIPGVVDLQIEPQVEVSQIRLVIQREVAASYGLSPGDVAELLDVAYRGRTVSQVFDEDRFHSIVVWFDEESRSNPKVIQETILDTPSGRQVALGQVAEVLDTTGPNVVNREHVQRRVAIFCNVQGRDLSAVVRDIQNATKPVEERLRQLSSGYFIEYGGQYQAQQQASTRLIVLGILSILLAFFLLCQVVRTWKAALQVLVNIPLATFGSIVALLLTNRPAWETLAVVPWWQWPQVWSNQTTLSLAHWVGFITLIGIVCRNGIMMISHYVYLMENEGEAFSKEMIVRGTLERLSPVLMTSMTSFIGLLPLLFGHGQPGKEILHPLSVVVFGGILASTLLDQFVTPALYYKFGNTTNQRPRS